MRKILLIFLIWTLLYECGVSADAVHKQAQPRIRRFFDLFNWKSEPAAKPAEHPAPESMKLQAIRHQPQTHNTQQVRDLPFGSGPCVFPTTTSTTPLPFIPLCPLYPQTPALIPQAQAIGPPYPGLIAGAFPPIEEQDPHKKKKKKPTGGGGVSAAETEIEEGEEAEAIGPAIGPVIQIGPGIGRPIPGESSLYPVVGPGIGPGMPEKLVERPIEMTPIGIGGIPPIGPAIGPIPGVRPRPPPGFIVGPQPQEPIVGPQPQEPIVGPQPQGPFGPFGPFPQAFCPAECKAMASAAATAEAHAEASALAAQAATAEAHAIAEATATATATCLAQTAQASAEAIARAVAEATAVAQATASGVAQDAVARAIAEATATATATAAGGPFLQGPPPPQVPCNVPYGCPTPNANCPGQVPFTPPGFDFVNPYNVPKIFPCSLGPLPPDVPRCNSMDMLERLQLRIMANLIRQAGLEPLFQQTDNYTFFAPVDQAFLRLPEWFLDSLNKDMKLLRAFILQHYIKIDLPLETIGNEFLILNARPGGNRLRFNVYFPENSYRAYTVDGSKVVLGNVETRNARLNVMNRVLVPNPPRNAAQYLQEVPEFSLFMSTVLSSDCLSILQGPDPITVFVPANRAFDTFDLTGLKSNLSAVSNFIRYHVVPGVWYSEGLVDGQYLTTLYEKELKVSASSDGLTKTLTYINGMNRVIKANIPVLNGVVHVIDSVLSSPDFYIYPHLSEFSVMEYGAMRRSGIEEPTFHHGRVDDEFLQRVNNFKR